MNRLGHYELRGLLGKGGMGEVYRARDTKLNRDVALKILPEAFAHDADRMARFEREAQVLASLNHPNIAAIYAVEQGALVMELVEGETLRTPQPLETALNYARQISDALEAAHEKGIVHRDLKPGNIMITPAGVVKVLDFGLAAVTQSSTPVADPANSPTLTMSPTRAGVILGTAAYMAPEQARGAVVDKRADIWSFGVVLYEMLTGIQPFAGATVSDTLAAVLKTEPDLARVPAQAQKLLRRCLDKDPKRRLRDIGDAMPLLEGAQESEHRSSPWWMIAAGAFAMIAALALWAPWRVTRQASQPLTRLSVDLPEFAFAPPEEGSEPSIALSSDGRRMVYTGRGKDGTVRLYTRTLDQEQASPLLGTEGAYGPFFSPDGQAVGFFAGRKMKKVSVERGGAVTLSDAPLAFGGSWGEDGDILAVLSVGNVVSRIRSAGRSVQPMTTLRKSKELGHFWPQALSRAQAVLFTSLPQTGTFDEATIEAQSLRTGERKTLIRRGYYGRYVPSGHLVYMHQGTLYAAPMNLQRLELTGPAAPVVEEVLSDAVSGFAQMDFSQTGTFLYLRGRAVRQTLVWMDSSGKTQPLRPTAAEYGGFVRFSADGKRLAMSLVEGGNANLWVYERERDTITRLTFRAGFDAFPVWAPDGTHIVFASSRYGGAVNLYWMRADGAGEAARLTESKNGQFPYSFSPDGKRIAFAEMSSQTNFDLWTVSLEDRENDHPRPGKPEPFLVTPFNENVPMISPDGRWLAYSSDESGQFEVCVRRFPGPGGKWQISTAGGYSPIWSREGQELFYRSTEGIMVASYTADGEAFVASKPRLWTAKKELGDIYDLAPDGKRFAVVQPEESERKGPQHVTFLLNFFDELRRRAPASK